MSVGYVGVQWSRHKRVYDALAAGAAALYLGAFVGVGKVIWTGTNAISDEVLVMRALGSCAFALLTLILCVGPATRLWPRVLPVLYNRRHLGVLTFLVALAHAIIAIGYYHGFGTLHPLVSLLAINTQFGSLRAFPYQLLGLAGLLVLFLLAATSHDFWLKTLTPRVWKGLHMLVYPAYGLLVAHVALGALQTDRGVFGPLAVGAGVAMVGGLHLAAGLRERRVDRDAPAGAEDGWLDAGVAAEIPEGRARTVSVPGGERIAVFKHAGALHAVEGVCAHQGGPLGEGKVIDGCITCPWHGWQYRPGDGCSPPPFTEKIRTYQVRVVGGRVRVNPRALGPGTAVPPARVEMSAAEGTSNGRHA